MVYKKIGDKIPSLSSLLLAGVLLTGSSCPDKDKPEVKTDSEPGKVEGMKQEDDGKGNGVVDAIKMVPRGFAEAAKKVMNYLIGFQGLGYLETEHSPRIRDGAFQEKDKVLTKDFKAVLRSLPNDRTLEAFPKDLHQAFKDLSILKDKKHVRLDQGTIRNLINAKDFTRAYAKAVDNVLRIFYDLRSFYRDMMLQVMDSPSQDKMAGLLSRLNQIRESVTSTLVRDFIFSNEVKHGVLYSGNKLARFFNDQKPGSTDLKTTRRNVKTQVLDVALTDGVLIAQNADPAVGPEDENMKNAELRGKAISSQWVVLKAGKGDIAGNTMPEIEPIPSGGLNYLFNKAECELSDVGEDLANRKKTGYIKSNTLTFGQLMFSILKGKESLDIVEVTKKTDGIQFTGHDDNLNKLLETFKQKEFPQIFYDHIRKTKLDKTFYILDKDAIFNKITAGIPKYNDDNERIMGNLSYEGDNPIVSLVALQGDAQMTAMQGNLLKMIEAETIGYKVLANILKDLIGFDIPLTSTPEVIAQSIAEKCSSIRSLNLGHFIESNASVEEKIGIEIIHKLFQSANGQPITRTNHPVIFSELSMQQVRAIVDSIIRTYSSSSILIREGGEYKTTYVTEAIKNGVRKLKQMLDQKTEDASVTYQQLEELVQHYLGDQKTSSFDIHVIRDHLEEDCNKLSSLLSVKVYDLLEKEGNINYGDYMDADILSSIGPDHAPLDKIRSEYIDAKKVPVTISSN